MAKAKKKQETAAAPAPAEKKEVKKAPAAAKAAAEAPVVKAGAPAKGQAKSAAATTTQAKPAPSAAPLIDTKLAALAAANRVVHRNLLGEGAGDPTPASGAPKPESASFKQLKQGFTKPAALNNLFGAGGIEKKSNTPFTGGGSKYHNQTQGGFNKTGVPRRTAGTGR